MNDRLGPQGRLWLGLFRAVVALLPPTARRDLLGPARADLERALRESRGPLGVFRLGTGAVLDAGLNIPVEWWRAWREWTDSNERVRTTMGDGIREWTKAARGLKRRPGFTAIAALTLALGIGVNLAIFAVVNAVLIRPLPFEDSERITWIRHHAPALGLQELQSSPGMANFYRASADEVLESSAVLAEVSANLSGTDRPDRVRLIEASPEVFDVFRMVPLVGRRLIPQDVEGEAAPVIVLTASAWQNRFGGDPGVIGRTLQIDDDPYEVVGVLPESFEAAYPDDLFGLRPYRLDPEGSWGSFGIGFVARYRDELTFDQAERRVQELQSRVADFVPSLDQEFLDGAGWAVTFEPLRERLIGDISTALWLIMGTVGIVFLIACANVANLFLVRAEERQREFAVHAALGAGRRRISRLVLRESVLLGLLGGAVGIGLAAAAVAALKAMDPGAMPRLGEVTVDGVVALAALALSVSAGMLFGSVALGRVFRISTSTVLRDGGMNATDNRGRHGARNVLVATQMALALMLLVGASLMVRSMTHMMAIDPGFDPEGVVTMGVALNQGTEPEQAEEFYRRAVERLAAIPGVRAAAGSNSMPLNNEHFAGDAETERFPPADDDLPKVTTRKAITRDYLEVMGVRLLQGQGPEDLPAEAAVAWVSESFLAEFLPGVEQPVGERFRLDGEDWVEIAGVVADTRELELTDDPRPLVMMRLPAYAVQTGGRVTQMTLAVRTEMSAAAFAPLARAAIADVDPRLPVTSVRSMERIVADSVATTTFTLWLLGLAATIALVLGTVGLYGVVAYVVGRRTREIGVRMALGAEGSTVQAMVVRQGFTVVAIGTVLGLGGAYALSRFMTGFLYGVSAHDPVSFAAAPAVLVVVSLLASWLPARRASRVDPVVALKAD